MSRPALAAALAALLCAVAWPAAAVAAEASAQELQALARAALDDPAALERLRAIDRVDGRPAELRIVLRGEAGAVRERLRALAGEPLGGGAGAPPRTTGDAGATARAILADERYQPSSFPRPLRGLVQDVGAAIFAPLKAVYEWLEDRLGPFGAWAVVAGVVLATAIALATRVAARRRALGGGAQAGVDGAQGERVTAAQLRARADRAERDGDLDAALRLRFRAGLLDLDARELIVLRPALTNHELLRAVPSQTLATLVAGFEGVAYGGLHAGADDVRGAREGWPRVLEEAGAR